VPFRPPLLLALCFPCFRVLKAEQFLEAGADIITTASYQCSIPGIMQTLKCDELKAHVILQRSVSVAVAARERWMKAQSNTSKRTLQPLLAASLGCFGAMLASMQGRKMGGTGGTKHPIKMDVVLALFVFCGADGSEYTGDYGKATQADVVPLTSHDFSFLLARSLLC
jgi:hypothetical protein